MLDALDNITTADPVQQTLSNLSSKVGLLQEQVKTLTESNDILVSYLRHNLTIGLLREPND